MKQVIFATVMLLYITSTYSQLASGSAINTCAFVALKNQEPNTSSDCAPKEGQNCCFVNTGTQKFCTLINGKLHEDVISELKTSLELPNLEIVCNNTHFINFTLATIFLLLFLF